MPGALPPVGEIQATATLDAAPWASWVRAVAVPLLTPGRRCAGGKIPIFLDGGGKAVPCQHSAKRDCHPGHVMVLVGDGSADHPLVACLMFARKTGNHGTEVVIAPALGAPLNDRRGGGPRAGNAADANQQERQRQVFAANIRNDGGGRMGPRSATTA